MRSSTLLLVAALAAGAAAQKTHPTPAAPGGESAPAVMIQCRDTAGQPVGSAEVHVFQRHQEADGRDRWQAFGPFMADAEGRARCPVALQFAGRKFDRFIYCRVPNRLVGVTRSASFFEGRDLDANGAVKVVLCPSRTLPGKVTVPDGGRPETVRVRMISMYVYDGRHVHNGAEFGSAFPREQNFADVDAALRSTFETQVRADGTFELRDVPQKGRIYVLAAGEGMGQTQFANVRRGPRDPAQPRIPETLRLTLRPDAVVEGKVLRADGTPAADTPVSVRFESGVGLIYMDTLSTVTGADGTFRVTGIPDCSVTIRAHTTTPKVTFRPVRARLRPDADKQVELRFEPAVAINGMVVDGATGRPLTGATIHAVTDHRPSAALDRVETDARGRFTVWVPKGRVHLYFSKIPRGYAYPETQIVEDVEVSGTINNLRLELTRGG